MKSPGAQLVTEAEALRQATNRNDFAGAQAAARRLVRAVEAGLPDLDVETRKSRLSEALQLIEFSRRSLRASQARLAGELALHQARARYALPATPPVNTWKISG